MTPTADLRVAWITDAPRVAGSEVWLLDVLPRLHAHGITSTVFLPPHTALDEFAARLGTAGVRAERYADLSALPARTQPFDLRALQVWDPPTYVRLLPRLAEPRLVVIHDQLDYHYPPPVRALYREIYRWTKARPLREADHLLTVSDWGGEFLRGQMGLPGVQAIRNGVDTGKFRPATPGERERLREALGFSRFTVLVPGRFAPEKNQFAAIRAARHAPELDFVFVGDADSGTGRLASAFGQRLGNVRFLGRRWDMPELYRASDALLQPTLAENQSLVTLESLASGLPVVTTPIPAQAELVQDGVTGLLVSPQGALLAAALRALAAHPARLAQMGQGARAHTLRAHGLEETAAGVARALRSAVSRRAVTES